MPCIRVAAESPFSIATRAPTPCGKRPVSMGRPVLCEDFFRIFHFLFDSYSDTEYFILEYQGEMATFRR